MRVLPACFLAILLTAACRERPAQEAEEHAGNAENLFLDAQHSASKRFAVLESDGSSGWLYLSPPGIKKPVHHAFVFSQVEPVKKFDVEAVRRGNPPVISRDMASSEAVLESPREADFEFVWSADGNSVAALHQGKPRAMIVAGRSQTYSVAIDDSCLLGEPFDPALYRATFSVPAE